MRTTLLAALLLPLLSTAQSDYLANDPVWTVTATCNSQGMGGGPCITTDTYNYKLAGDSVIDGVTYVRVERSGTVVPLWIGGPPAPSSCMESTTYGPWLAGLIRQEGRSLRLWNGDSDVLLHDFDLEVGDLLPLSATNNSDQVMVIALDSVQMNGEWRHRYTLQNSWAQELIEGVGSSFGLFEPITDFFDCGYTLNCFSLVGQAYYPEPGPDCDLHIGMAEEHANTLSFGPNPTDGRLTVQLPTDLLNAPVTVMDAQGRICLRIAVTGSTVGLDLAGLPVGTYILTIGTLRGRVVLMPR